MNVLGYVTFPRDVTVPTDGLLDVSSKNMGTVIAVAAATVFLVMAWRALPKWLLLIVVIAALVAFGVLIPAHGGGHR